eukprot:COSAG02_NODE_2223_length_9455_cov_5.513675_7_plen_236_part_00
MPAGGAAPQPAAASAEAAPGIASIPASGLVRNLATALAHPPHHPTYQNHTQNSPSSMQRAPPMRPSHPRTINIPHGERSPASSAQLPALSRLPETCCGSAHPPSPHPQTTPPKHTQTTPPRAFPPRKHAVDHPKQPTQRNGRRSGAPLGGDVALAATVCHRLCRWSNPQNHPNLNTGMRTIISVSGRSVECAGLCGEFYIVRKNRNQPVTLWNNGGRRTGCLLTHAFDQSSAEIH